MSKLSNMITKIEEVIVIILMAALAILMTLSVVFRYFLKDPIPWAGEVSIFLLIWTSFLEACQYKLKHSPYRLTLS